jgi:hypothetical protein
MFEVSWVDRKEYASGGSLLSQVSKARPGATLPIEIASNMPVFGANLVAAA